MKANLARRPFDTRLDIIPFLAISSVLFCGISDKHPITMQAAFG